MPMKDRPSSALKPPPEGTLCCCSPGDPSLGHAPAEGVTTGVIDASGTLANIQRTSLPVQHTNNVRLSELTNQLRHTNNVRLSELTNQLRHTNNVRLSELTNQLRHTNNVRLSELTNQLRNQFAGLIYKQNNLQ